MFEQPKIILPTIEPTSNKFPSSGFILPPISTFLQQEIDCKKVFLATVLHGVTKQQCISIPNHLGCMPTVTDTQWHKLIDNFKPKLQQLVNDCLLDAIKEEIGDNPDTFNIIANRSRNVRGLSSPPVTVCALGMKTKKIVGVSILINEGKFKNCDVSSKAMEELGTERICEFFQNNNLRVTSFLHDGAGSSFNSALKFFPNCKELWCVNHAAKNIGKWAKETLGERFGFDVRYAFWCACRNASQAPNPEVELKNEFVVMLNHFGGLHTLCRHHKVPSKPQKCYLDIGKVDILRKKLYDFLGKPELLSHGQTQSHVAFFNKEITEFAPKHLLVPSLYECRILLAVLKHNLGPKFVYLVYDLLDIPIPLSVEQQVCRKIAKRMYFQKWVITNSQPKKKFRKRKKSAEHYYGKKEEKKQEIKETTTCRCQKNGCVNNHCSCKKNFNACTPACRCTDCKNNHKIVFLSNLLTLEE